MRPRRDDESFVDVIDVLLRDGAILRADVIVSVADIPLLGIKLTAAIAGMETMNEYGIFEEWDTTRRLAGISRRQNDDREQNGEFDELTELGIGSTHDGVEESDESEN
ncbi:gas vesicle protein GvpM [Natrinema ejinorense]|uniref:Gas vesicle protein GvpA n=1 Tax=Natrinema ejinorense TaxID=373386 RepID=A0A2A5QW86_9EURY|nr:gas vesicle protein GvpJ [Natrinema ejinorense]PCR91064.1 gas vesicle protein GvpA [Natrinema ejinorense]